MANVDKGVVVVGGGVAGICATRELALAGLPVTILEKNGFSMGGRVCAYPSTAFEYQGRRWEFTLEHGIHGWWRQYRNFLALIAELGLERRMIDAFDQTILFHDGRQTFRTNVGRETQITPVIEPLHHGQLLFKRNIQRMMTGRDFLRMANLGAKILETVQFDPWDPAHRRRYDSMNVSDFSRGVPYFFQAFLRSLSRSGFFSDPQHVSLWAFMVALQHYVFLSRPDQRFAFPRGPVVREILDPMLQQIREAGGSWQQGVTVQRVARADDGGWWLEWQREEGAASGEGAFAAPSGRLHATDLVLAVDVEGAKSLAARSPDLGPVLGDLSVFNGHKATTVRMWFTRSPGETTGDSGIFSGKATADSYFWLHRFQDEFMDWHLETGGSVVECHLYAPPWKHALSDEDAFTRVQRDMENAFPELAFSCVHHTIVRNPATHINFPVGCARSFPKVETCHPDLALCGDWIDGGTPVLYMERACQTSRVAANAILRRHGLPEVMVRKPLDPPNHMQRLQAMLRWVDRLAPGIWPTGPRQAGAAAEEEDSD